MQNSQVMEFLVDGPLHDVGREEDILPFLRQKAQLLDFDTVLYVTENGDCYSTRPVAVDVTGLPGILDSFQGDNGVSFLDRQSVMYSIPVKRDGRVAGVLAGIRDKENMQNLIQPVSFSGNGLTCITDSEANVIISPTNLEPFLQLDNIFAKNRGSDEGAQMERMQKDMKEGRSGVFSFTAVDGKKLVLSYVPLKSYDWVLLTLVPADLISAETDAYILQTFLVIAGTILFFILFFLVVVRVYRSHYRQLELIAYVDPVTGGMNNAAFQAKCRKVLKGAAGRNR